ncbi:MAG: cupin-like domain-containing protein [Deltaproteobacteria bacterium]|nr:cupin-like domain-containing protein [Deltaproteobacteria bacterium]
MSADLQDESLSPAWQRWAIDNLARGVKPAAVIARLVQEGLSQPSAELALATLWASGAIDLLRESRAETARLALLARMQRTLQHSAMDPKTVVRTRDVSASQFFDHYYAHNVPVVLEGFAAQWPACAKWSPEYFRTTLGHLEVEACLGRDRDPKYDQNFRAHTQRMVMSEFADRVIAAGESNDLYLIANNRNMDRAPMASLYDDCDWSHGLLNRARVEQSVALWFGPSGTVTPLHHDTTNILFCQIYGQKRVLLAHPAETALRRGGTGVYSIFDPESPGPDDPKVLYKTAVLNPGDALLIPVGWWHHVRALSISINIAFANFARPNDFAWFTP